MKILLILFCLTPIYSLACDCSLYPVECYVDTSEFIFLGKAVSYLKGDSSLTKMTVKKDFKKNIEGPAIVFKSLDSNCSLKPEIGECYLIFGFAKKNLFYNYSCSFTGEVKYSKGVIRKIKRALHRIKKGKGVC